VASAAEEKRQAELREYYRRNPHMRPEDPLAETSRTKVAKKGASVREQIYQQQLAARKARMKKKPTAKVNKGGMYKGKKHTYATGGVVKDMKIIRSK
tara:strand:- start:30 stop:320 length:291 start_codon:yes stop_codon:yes gene_type:complete